MMGIRLRTSGWRRVGLAVGVMLPCVLAVAAREMASWRPRVLLEAGGIDVAFSPVEPLLACTTSGANVVMVQVWDSGNKDLLWSQATSSAAGGLQFSPDGKMLATLGEQITLWDAHTGEYLKGIRFSQSNWSQKQFHFSEDGRSVVVIGNKDEIVDTATGDLIEFYDVASVRVKRSIMVARDYGLTSLRPQRAPHRGRFRRINNRAITPDGQTLLTTLGIWEKVKTNDWSNGFLRPEIWMGDERSTFQQRLIGAGSVADISGDSRWMVAYSPESTPVVGDLWSEHARSFEWGASKLQLWYLGSKTLVREFSLAGPRYKGRISELQFSQDGTLVMACVSDGQGLANVVIWEVSSGRVLRRFLPERKPLSEVHLALSEDNSQMAITGWDNKTLVGKLRLWRVQ